MEENIYTPYNVILWNFNADDIEYYDIMPYLLRCWDEEKLRRIKLWSEKPQTTKMPKTFDEYKTFITHFTFMQFWSRCQYETLIESNLPNGMNLYNYRYVLNDEKHTDGPYLVVDYCGDCGEHSVWVTLKSLVNHYLGNGGGEILITGFPTRNNCKKIDAYDQVLSNIDVITHIFMDNIKIRKRNKKR